MLVPDSRRMSPSPSRPWSLPLFLAALAAIYLWSLHGKLAEYRGWQAAPERLFAGQVPVAGTDSYLYFRRAREHQQGTAPVGRDALRRFPTGLAPVERSLLAEGMALVSDWTGADPYRTGIWITMLGAGLFAFPLGLYFHRLGAPLAGLWGAFVGSLGTSYSLRTAPHRVDTDGGNLFLLCCVSLLVLEAGLRRGRGALVAAAGAGLCLNAFCLWYQQPAFALLFGATFLLHLAAQRVDARTRLMLGVVFLVCADPLNLWRGGADLYTFVLRYLVAGSEDPAAVVGSLRFPSILPEIAELRRLPLLDSLGLAAGQPLLGLLGLAGLAVFAWRRPLALLPILPVLALAWLGLLRSQRFLMYLGPLLGVGCGELMGLALARARPRAAAAAGVAPLGLLLFLLPAPGLSRPGVSAELLGSLQRMAKQLPPGAVIAHSWAQGYLVTDLTGAATFNDGQDPDPVVEQLLDRGLTDADPAVLHDLVSFLASRGRAGVDAAAGGGSYADLLAAMRGAQPPPDHPLYLLLSDKMLRGFGNTWVKGRWDFEAGRGDREGYDLRGCRRDADALVCSKEGKPDLRVDPQRGLLNGSTPIAHYLRVASGTVRDERSYAQASAMWLQHIEPEGAGGDELHILKAPVFASNFNQMFVLGRFDPELFRLELDDFPTARLYAVLPRR